MNEVTPGETPRPRRGAAKHDRVNIRRTHPGLYRSILTLSIMSVALAINFWISNPTFNPYGIPKDLIGLIFFLLGWSQLIFLVVVRSLQVVRFVLAVSLGFILFWGITNTQQFFAGNASLQLPILYVTIAALHVPILIESPVNPMTRTAHE